MGVPTMYSYMLSHYSTMQPGEQEAARAAAARLRLTVSGSAACPLPIMEQWQRISGEEHLAVAVCDAVQAASSRLLLECNRNASQVSKPCLAKASVQHPGRTAAAGTLWDDGDKHGAVEPIQGRETAELRGAAASGS
jgi:acyl-CoA synthetase (AMP-forming)/AMP-acid ligase II